MWANVPVSLHTHIYEAHEMMSQKLDTRKRSKHMNACTDPLVMEEVVMMAGVTQCVSLSVVPFP